MEWNEMKRDNANQQKKHRKGKVRKERRKQNQK
jgi:hypothetical protein